MTALRIGSTLANPADHVELTASRFNRHTFWCGQSGSGKTYALGVVLEQLLIQTALPLVILDPNGDFTRLGEVRPETDAAEAAALRARDIRVLDPAGELPLRARFAAMSLAAKAAVLHIDPLADREEYNALLHVEDDFDPKDPRGIGALLAESPNPVHQRLAQRIDNLRLMQWGIWAFDRMAATEVIAERPDATVVNLGGFEYAEESLVIALSILEDLWKHREERRPILIVIDEAHNFCSPELDSALARAVRDQIVRIAAEGRKYGLWLLLSTQRPSRIHSSILSQCDNLALMKMSSPIDLVELTKVFGFAPEDLVLQSPGFTQGQALFAGGFVQQPQLVQMRSRRTFEGGGDVGVPLR